MKIYATLLDRLAGRDLETMAAQTGVAIDSIRATAERGMAMDRADREPLATYLGEHQDDLFRVWTVLEDGTWQIVDLEPGLPPDPAERFVTDPTTLRRIG